VQTAEGVLVEDLAPRVRELMITLLGSDADADHIDVLTAVYLWEAASSEFADGVRCDDIPSNLRSGTIDEVGAMIVEALVGTISREDVGR